MEYAAFLSERCRAVESSGIRRFFDRAARAVNPVDLSIGQPDYDADDAVRDAAIDALREGLNRYTPSAGIPQLRQAVARQVSAEYPGWDPSVLITSGVSGGLVLALMATINPGDEVIFLDPYFVSYVQLVRMIGGVPRPVSAYPDFAFPAEAVERAITRRTRVLLLNSPANPTGRVMTPAEMKAACDLAKRHNLLIVADEIYKRLTFDGINPCPATHAPERTIVLGGFGKTYGVTGWRMAYVAAPEPLIDSMIKLQQYTFVCAPTPFQHAILRSLEVDVSHHCRDYAAKRDLAYQALKDAFQVTRPGGGFYLFPKIPARFKNASDFCEAAADKEVFVIPGCIFSGQDTHFRVSFATSDENLRRGCAILSSLAGGA